MKLTQLVNAINATDLNQLSSEELIKLDNELQKHIKNAKVNIGLTKLMDIFTTSEMAYQMALEDTSREYGLEDEVTYKLKRLFNEALETIIVAMSEASETTGLKESTGRWG